MRDMKYKFDYQITALDLWKLSMCGVYSSIIGILNIIFTVAMLFITKAFWGDVNSFIKIIFIVGIGLFTVIQPAAIYIRAKRQVNAIPHDLQICFNDDGIHIKSKKQNSKLKWNVIKGISKKPGIIVIYTITKHGYILTDKVLGKQKEDFYSYVVSKINMRQS